MTSAATFRLFRHSAAFLAGVAGALALGGHFATAIVVVLIAGALAFTALTGALRQENRR